MFHPMKIQNNIDTNGLSVPLYLEVIDNLMRLIFLEKFCFDSIVWF